MNDSESDRATLDKKTTVNKRRDRDKNKTALTWTRPATGMAMSEAGGEEGRERGGKKKKCKSE